MCYKMLRKIANQISGQRAEWTHQFLYIVWSLLPRMWQRAHEKARCRFKYIRIALQQNRKYLYIRATTPIQRQTSAQKQTVHTVFGVRCTRHSFDGVSVYEFTSTEKTYDISYNVHTYIVCYIADLQGDINSIGLIHTLATPNPNEMPNLSHTLFASPKQFFCLAIVGAAPSRMYSSTAYFPIRFSYIHIQYIRI